MRLNWNNIGKGLEGIADAKRASDLARESARYDVTEGAYGEGLGQNLQNVIGARDQALQRLSGDAYIRGEEATPEERQQIIDQYTPALSELSRRVGLQSPDYSVASGPTNFATRQEARQAAAPLRAEGLAGVYRRYGDVERADALETRAYEQQRALAAERRAEAGESRAAQDFSTRQSLTGLQIEAGQLTLAEKKRKEEADKNLNNFNIAFGEANALAESEGRTLTARDISALAKANKLTFGQENELIASQVNRTESEVKQFRLDVEKVTQGKGFEQLVDLHKNDKRFGDGMHFVPEIDKKTGGVVLARFNEATGKIEERLPFKTKAEATAYLREEAANPANAAIWLQNYRKGEAGINRDIAATRASDATVGLTTARTDALKQGGKNSQEIADLYSELIELTPEEQEGAKGRGLLKRINVLNLKAGGQVSLGAAPKAEGPVRMDDVDRENLRAYRDWEKDPRNARLPQGQKDAKAAQLGVTQFVNRAAAGPQTGLGSNPFSAGASTATPAAAPAAAAKPAAPAAPALSMENTKILSAAGKGSWNVQLPDGTTRIMSEAELNRLGYQFLRR